MGIPSRMVRANTPNKNWIVPSEGKCMGKRGSREGSAASFDPNIMFVDA